MNQLLTLHPKLMVASDWAFWQKNISSGNCRSNKCNARRSHKNLVGYSAEYILLIAKFLVACVVRHGQLVAPERSGVRDSYRIPGTGSTYWIQPPPFNVISKILLRLKKPRQHVSGQSRAFPSWMAFTFPTRLVYPPPLRLSGSLCNWMSFVAVCSLLEKQQQQCC